MSISISGITFAEQPVTPNDDGALYGAILADGVLDGVGVSYSAASLIVAPGRLIVGTRECRIPAQLTIPVDGATSGYARLKITVDMTQTSSVEVFSQVYADVEYSATVGGFPSLTQQDINNAGTIYQVVLAVMTMGTAGITGIVETLPPASVGRRYTNVVVLPSAFLPNQTHADVGYGLRAAIPLTGVTVARYPDITFAGEDALSGNYFPTCDSYDGGVYIYAASAPDAVLVIPAILISR